MDKNINQSLLSSQSKVFKYDADELAEICNLDNHYKDEKSANPSRTISSGMIMEKFNGPNEIMAALQTNPNTGIAGTKEDIAQRQKEFGANFFPPPEIKTLYELVMENFDDPINLVLLAAAAVSLIIGFIKEGFPEGMIEGSSICFALIIIIVVNSGNNYLSERRLAEQLKMCEKQMVSVYRNSEQTVSIDSAELVVGDIFVLEPGMNIPADSILLSG